MGMELTALIAVLVLLLFASVVAIVSRIQLKRTREREKVFRCVLDKIVDMACAHGSAVKFEVDLGHADAEAWLIKNNAKLSYISSQTSIAWLVQMLIRHHDDILDTKHMFLRSYGNSFDERARFAYDLRQHIAETNIKFDDLEKVVNLPLGKIVAEIEALSEQPVRLRTVFSTLDKEEKGEKTIGGSWLAD